MATFPRDEVEAAFRHYWQVGAVGEDWDAWADLFTDDAVYVEHFYGTMHGRETIREWIKPVMASFPELYTALDWYMIEGGRVVFAMQNRRDHPDSSQPPIDFPGVTILRYAGDNRWSYEEDYWAFRAANETIRQYAEACAAHDPDHPQKRTRRHWPDTPEWAAPMSATA